MNNIDDINPWQGLVIGEVACGHEGDLKRLTELIDVVASGKADYIKFQIFELLERAVPGEEAWEIFKKLVLTPEEWEKAFLHARNKNLKILADVYGDFSFSLAKRLGVDGYKIHSEDLLNTFFIERVAKESKLLLISVGGAHRNEIYSLAKYLKKKGTDKNIVLMTGVQTFPTPMEAHSISEIEDLSSKYKEFGFQVGFSDHIAGDNPDSMLLPLMALSAGACIIEKHVTVDRNLKWIDYHSALGKEEFRDFVSKIKRLAPLLKPVDSMNKEEMQYRKMFKKTPVLSKSLRAGSRIQETDILFKKFTSNSRPISSSLLLDKELNSDLSSNTVLKPIHFKTKVGGIIVARCTSNRLPNKALLNIEGKESIALVIERMKRCKNLDLLVLATSTDPSDDILIDIAKREGIPYFRGDLDNVSSRFFYASKEFNLTHFVRITGDAILCDEIMTDQAIESHLESGCDVTFIKNMPLGTNKEVINVTTIETILERVKVPSNTEYLEYFLENSRYFSINYITSDYSFDPKIRITLDYQEDYQFFARIFAHFNKYKPNFTLRDVLEYLKENPEVAQINMHLNQKYQSKDLNVSLLI